MKRIYNMILMISILTLGVIASASTVKIASAQGHAGPYFAIEPSQTIIGPEPAVGENFTVEVKLLNITADNAAAGISGIEIHVTWNNSLIEPISFSNHVGLADGVLAGPSILYGISAGFYKDDTNLFPVSAPPYTNATYFNLAAASSSGPWWSNSTTSGTIAEITFKVNSQPLPYANSTIHFNDLLSYLVDAAPLPSSVPHDADDGILLIKNAVTTNETVTFAGVGNYSVSIFSDSTITAPPTFSNSTGTPVLTFNVTSPDGFCNVTVPYNFMWGTWTVKVDDTPLASPNVAVTTDTTGNSYVWFNFTAGDHAITLTSQYYVPEFATTSLMLFLMATTIVGTAVATSFRRRKFHR
jgi:hypothetical protein